MENIGDYLLNLVILLLFWYGFYRVGDFLSYRLNSFLRFIVILLVIAFIFSIYSGKSEYEIVNVAIDLLRGVFKNLLGFEFKSKYSLMFVVSGFGFGVGWEFLEDFFDRVKSRFYYRYRDRLGFSFIWNKLKYFLISIFSYLRLFIGKANVVKFYFFDKERLYRDLQKEYEKIREEKEKLKAQKEALNSEILRFEEEKSRFQREREEFERTRKKQKEEDFSKLDPYEILGVSRFASKEEIKRAYLKKISEYHPDKVASLGEKLRKLAEEETKKINWAWDRLR